MEPQELELTEEQKAIRACELYSENLTFAQIADEIGCSKSFTSELVKRGILRLQERIENDKVQELTHHADPQTINPNSLPVNHEIMPEPFMLETQGIPRRIVLSPLRPSGRVSGQSIIIHLWAESIVDLTASKEIRLFESRSRF